ncbi:MAG: hypothetical protein K6F09_05425, partial [Clostridiales bacterium]|nr:hypothetical protein [Clostridiales bacterium]
RRRAIVRKTYENAVSAGDKNVAFVDGGTFADGMEDILKYSCTQDGTHPTDVGFLMMAQKIGEKIELLLK